MTRIDIAYKLAGKMNTAFMMMKQEERSLAFLDKSKNKKELKLLHQTHIDNIKSIRQELKTYYEEHLFGIDKDEIEDDIETLKEKCAFVQEMLNKSAFL